MAKKIAVIFGIIIFLVGFFGFFPNPIIGAGGKAIFEANFGHNLIHIVIGAVMLAMAARGENAVGWSLKIFGGLFVLMGILGFVMKSPMLGILTYNSADNWLHLVLGIVLVAPGMVKKSGSLGEPTQTRRTL